MSEKINTEDFDLMMKSILDEAREDVPERVWEGVSAGLDKAAGRKAVVLWFRRAAAGVAAAAVVALGIFFAYNGEDELVPAMSGDMIAVVEPEAEETVPDEAEEVGDVTEMKIPVLMAEAGNIVPEVMENPEAEEDTAVENEQVEDEVINEKSSSQKPETSVEKTEPVEYFPTVWDDEPEKSRNVSLVVSGLTGTNNAMKQNRMGMMMRPSVTPAPEKSCVQETSTRSSYGVPLSFGVGARFDLNSRWSIGTGLNYTFLTRQFYGKYTKVSKAGDIESVISDDIRNQQHYIGIPVNAFYNIINNDKINFYAYAGGAMEKCVSDSYRLLNTSINHKESIKGIQMSVNAGIGVEFMLGKTLGLYIDPSVRYYFKNKTQPKSIRTIQPLMLGFEMGLRAKL